MTEKQVQTMDERTFGRWLAAQQKAITSILPKHMTPERVMRLALLEARRTPALLNCTPESVVGAVVQAAQIGLEVGSHLGHAWPIPFKNNKTRKLEAQLVVGYKGMIDLAYRSDRVATIYADVVHEGDFFEFALGSDGHIKHIPNFECYSARIIVSYCVLRMANGATLFRVVGRKEIDAAKARAPGASRSDSAWTTDFDSMAMKTAVRRLFKYMPVSVEIQRAVNLDELAEAGISQGNADLLSPDYSVMDGDGKPPVPTTRTDQVKADLVGDKPPAEAKDRSQVILDISAASAIKHVENIETKYTNQAEVEGWVDELLDCCSARIGAIRDSRVSGVKS